MNDFLLYKIKDITDPFKAELTLYIGSKTQKYLKNDQ